VQTDRLLNRRISVVGPQLQRLHLTSAIRSYELDNPTIELSPIPFIHILRIAHLRPVNTIKTGNLRILARIGHSHMLKVHFGRPVYKATSPGRGRNRSTSPSASVHIFSTSEIVDLPLPRPVGAIFAHPNFQGRPMRSGKRLWHRRRCCIVAFGSRSYVCLPSTMHLGGDE
jgi:hypothetical protein